MLRKRNSSEKTMSSVSGTEFRGCVIVPTYNSGALLENSVREALGYWQPVIVVVDGSTDGSAAAVETLARKVDGLHVLGTATNGGKGAAVLLGLEFAAARGFTHAAVFDADGQHEASDIPLFMQAAKARSKVMVLGVPIFDANAPTLRVNGRLAGNWWANLETWWGGVKDSLFGFRVYPIQPSLEIMANIHGARRFDFDTQLAVRLYWKGVQPVNIPTRVRYRARDDGGVSHFRYLRDNALLFRVHVLLFLISLTMMPRLARYRRRPAIIFPRCPSLPTSVEV